MKIKFWGVRGSIPSPGAQYVKYGGNTLCVELYLEDIDRLIIIDAGSGLRLLGNHLITEGLSGESLETDIFLTHTHLDHIIGFPFFAPIFQAGTRLKIYGPVTYEDDSLETVIGGQLSYRYFPVRQEELTARIEYINLKEGRFDLGDGIRLITKYLNHPLLCLGFRFEYRGKICCTAYDTEPFQNLFITDPRDPAYDEIMAHQGEAAASDENHRLEEFFTGADLLIHDAQYTRQEYDTDKYGWGHCPIEYAIEAAMRSQVKRLALFHHDPMRTDAQLDELAKLHCDAGNTGNTEAFFAREGMQVVL
ncbi:MAG: MBL fold metallo-hydrolase [Deltaproteobacteria bacterium]|jgi:phosphoribosyl 1,2-cyclic phosphodiesterase